MLPARLWTVNLRQAPAPGAGACRGRRRNGEGRRELGGAGENWARAGGTAKAGGGWAAPSGLRALPGSPQPSEVSSSDSNCTRSGSSSGKKTLMSSFSLPGGRRQST